MSPGTRHGGSGLFKRSILGFLGIPGRPRSSGAGAWGRSGRGEREAGHYTGRHVTSWRQAARLRAGKAVPVTVAAAALVAGASAFALAGGGYHSPATVAAVKPLPADPAGGAGRSGGQAATAADAAMLKAASAKVSRVVPAATARVRPAADSAPAKPSGKQAASRAGGGTALAASPAATARSSARPSPSASASQAARATGLSCAASGGPLPANVTAIVSFLLAHGYSGNAAAGIAGNIYQESKGDPESVGTGGGGLIGWTPLPAGFVTGNPAADLQAQLNQILVYNQVWASYLPALNSAASPAAAADIYVTDFERAGIPAASTREASAQAVAAACGI